MNDDNRRGPWDVSLPQFVTKKLITAVIRDLKNDLIEKEFELDYGSYEDRKFLGRLSFWAITNGRSVETMAVEEWKRINKDA